MSSTARVVRAPTRGASRADRGPARPSTLISGRLTDSFWILLSPIVAFLVLKALWSWSGFSDLAIFSVLFAFIVTGHHMPGWIRAFGEPDVYAKHKARLWVSLFAIPALAVLPALYGLGAVALTVAAAFDLWHVAMQQHGFGRIYAAKARDVSKQSARLDLACVLVWYVTVVAWSDSWMQAIARSLRLAGLPLFDLFSRESWAAIKWALLAASVALLAAYVLRAVRLWRDEHIATPTKHLLHLAAFSVLIFSYQDPSWYRAQSVQNLFHATQYLFLVWIYGHLSIRRNSERAPGFYRLIFQSRRGMLVFAALVGLYGVGAYALYTSGYRLTGGSAEKTVQLVGSIALASLFLHFYVDSFIWKVRSTGVQKALAIENRGSEPAPATRRTPLSPQAYGAVHAIAYFGIPILAITLIGAGRRQHSVDAERAAVAHEARLFPRSAYAHFLAGQTALQNRDAAAARAEWTAALDLSPSFEGPAKALADLDVKEGRTEEEIEHARAAVRAQPRDANLRYLLGNALARARRLGEAEGSYRAAIRLRARFAGAHEGLGVVLKWQDRFEDALPHFRRAYDLAPDLSDAACNLSGTLATLGRTEEALAVIGQYRSKHPNDEVAAQLEAAIRRGR